MEQQLPVFHPCGQFLLRIECICFATFPVTFLNWQLLGITVLFV